MAPMHHPVIGLTSASVLIVFALAFASFCYVRGWSRKRGAPSAIPTWRLASFLFGMLLVWGALASPLAAYDHDLLTVHMIQHLLLMTFAPALILLGEPLLAIRPELSRLRKLAVGSRPHRPTVQQLGRSLPWLVLCWTASALTLLAWHVPALFAFGISSPFWHSAELVSFFVAGVLFWWPVIQPWPSVSPGPQWSTLLYLFLATLPCDILSGYLVFSDRVVYPAYFSAPRRLGFTVLADQQCAAALMWTCVTLVYLVPAVIISTQLLSPRILSNTALSKPESRSDQTAHNDPQRLEAV